MYIPIYDMHFSFITQYQNQRIIVAKHLDIMFALRLFPAQDNYFSVQKKCPQ